MAAADTANRKKTMNTQGNEMTDAWQTNQGNVADEAVTERMAHEAARMLRIDPSEGPVAFHNGASLVLASEEEDGSVWIYDCVVRRTRVVPAPVP